MRAPDLVVGAKYILKQAGDPVAVYEGKHEGTLVLADGSSFYGARGALRFRYTDVNGVERVALLETAAEVSEPEATREEREKIAARRAAHEARVMQEAAEFCTALGFTLAERSYEVHRAADPSRTVSLNLRYPNGMSNETEVEIEEFTVSKLRMALRQHAKDVLYLIDHGASEADALSGKLTVDRSDIPSAELA